MIVVSIDIETTGLDPLNCDIIEFGAVVDNLADQKSINELPRWHTYVLPTNRFYRGDPYALSMHPTIFKRIATREAGFSYCYPGELGAKFQKWLLSLSMGFERKAGAHSPVVFNAVGKNFGAFDLQFLKQHEFELYAEPRYRILDPAVLYLEAGDLAIPGTTECKHRLIKACPGVDMPAGVSHTAIDDALDVIMLTRYGLRHLYRPVLATLIVKTAMPPTTPEGVVNAAI